MFFYFDWFYVFIHIISDFITPNQGYASADYILLHDPINDKNDTIVNSTNLKDVSFSNSNVNLYFYGKPKIYDDTIAIKKNIAGFNIKVDTTAIFTGFKRSESYQKK